MMSIKCQVINMARPVLCILTLGILCLGLEGRTSGEPITVGRVLSNGLIAYTLRDYTGRLQIFAAYADGSNKRQLTFVGDNGRPDWSPDGTKIVFTARRGKRIFVAVMDADGSNQTLLTEGGGPDWSPDGRQIAFSRGGQIWVVAPEGSNPTQITTSPTLKAGPSWSPNGKQMVFILITNRDPEHPKPEIGIMNSDGTQERILTTEDRVNIRVEKNGAVTVLETAHAANAPAWSPVDNRVAFWSGIERRYGQVWVMNVDGTGSTQLTEDPAHRNSDDPSWSPDGSKILFSTGRSGRNELWVMDANGRNERRLFNIDVNPFPGRASWQPVKQ
ncbi:MAG: hypothetical protein ACYS80_13275 [Planctomycetota bacterium]